MAFPDIEQFTVRRPGPYEKQMGRMLSSLLEIYRSRVPDSESHERVSILAATPSRWSAGHAVFDEVRRRNLIAIEDKDQLRGFQYAFEESCCQALYNATMPTDPFDPSSAFFVVPQALGLARVVGISIESVHAALDSDAAYA